ncbi:GuaB3 family IMP dehydrogenase-related protein [bacterium]|nr:GuaB3 family IMP dehydrogenase-related protein [bacterium]
MENLKESFLPQLQPTYGFDDVSILPGVSTLDPKDVDTSVKFGKSKLKIPIIASAMDSAVDVNFASRLSEVGSMGVLNLEGLQTKYENPTEAFNEITSCNSQEAIKVIQKFYAEPIKEELVSLRVQELKNRGIDAAVSVTPANAERLGFLARDAGADIIFIQATVISSRHRGKISLNIKDFIERIEIPVVLGNCVTQDVAYELMQTGPAGILVGIGPGAACTTRAVTGVGVGQVTATMSCCKARDVHFEKTGKYVSIITDGGMRKGGEISKAIASGADAVMLGSCFSGLKETPGEGYHWGMATQDPNLPRGTRVSVKNMVELEKLFFGPSDRDDGTLNLVGGLKNSMGMVGAMNIQEMQKATVVHCPSLKDEGKHYQFVDGVGQAK